jgi:membrane peptidoglycan carboxypeptidase
MSQRIGTWVRVVFWSTAGALLALGVICVVREMKTSDLQARYLSSIGDHLHFRLEPGSSPAIRYPTAGPYDERLGYTALSKFQKRLGNLGFSVTAQARFSPELLRVADNGLYVTYFEKVQAGLTILDRNDSVLFSKAYPERVYPDFDTIPPLVIKTLLFIENRELLDDRYPHLNPAVEWDRLGRATMELIASKLGANINVAGGSTLATQMEKYRHSPGGRTDNPWEKLRQMSSASLRAYLSGPDTRKTRRAIVQAYLNSMPLAAAPESGEVHGLGDGLAAWFGSDFAAVNQLLNAANMSSGEGITAEQALAYRQVLCLLLAQRRPAYYLLQGRTALEKLADSHLRLLAAQGIIPPALRDAALQVSSDMRVQSDSSLNVSVVGRKTESVLRARLATDLGVSRMYDLDRLDLTARSTIDHDVQQAVTKALRKLRDPEQARAAGVLGFRLLSSGDDFDKIVYSLVLYERTSQGNLLRVQADNHEQPLDVNEGIRLDLGSTAKLRTLVHYLEIIAELYDQYAPKSREALRRIELHPRDHLSRWVIDQLLANRKITLSGLLEAALERRYSANPGEAFFTGGGLHTFANFSKDDNGRVMSVRKALQNSVNLVFIRLMRDVVYYHLYKPDGVARWMDQEDSEKRREYLERFADQEGKTYLRRFYAKYRNKTPEEAFDLLTKSVRPVPKRLATVYRSVYPHADLAGFQNYLKGQQADRNLSDKDITSLYEKYSPERFDLQDRGYIARIHPLELWLVSYLAEHPNATLGEILGASATARLEVYRWLFRTSRRHAQDQRIRTLLENEAFAHIHRAWKRLGYPFAALTPSYASAIGASGDRPAALAELMGILLNDGLRFPIRRFDTFRFAADTPYETLMELSPAQSRRVLPPEVAAAARSALVDVVERGTAVRVKDVYKSPAGTRLVMAGKTGTGDHQREIFGPGGRLISTQVVSRTATFAFMLGDRHFGTVTAYVTGSAAARFRFTSALPVQVLKSLEPTLAPLIKRAYTEQPELSPRTITAATAKGDRPAAITGH